MGVYLTVVMGMLLPWVVASAATLGTAFTYQGHLLDSGLPASGVYDIEFSLYDAASGGTQKGSIVQLNDVTVTNGQFTVTVDPAGGDVNFYNGDAFYIQLAVRPGASTGGYTALSPRQLLTAMPYAVAALKSSGGSGFSLPYEGTTAAPMAFAATTTAGTIGIRGLATNFGGTINYGGYFEAYGSQGIGVAGVTPGALSWGVYGHSLGSSGRGVFGEARDGGVGVLGRHEGTSNYAELATADYGVHAVAFAGTGVYSQASGTGAVAVSAQSSSGDGVAAYSGGSGKSGVYAYNGDAGGFGVVGRNTANGNYGFLGGSYGVYGYCGSGSGYAGVFRGKLMVQAQATGTTVAEIGEGLDYAEGFDVAGKDRILPGAVLVIDEDNPGKLAISRQAYDRKVAGIVAGARNLGSGVRLGAGQFDHDVALAGRVYCNVDASFGEIRPGDLLTTSPTPGYAMVVKDHGKATGAVLGKAMERLEKGKGQVLVLVTLQ